MTHQELKQGYVQVYTGNGKGKSTASFGLALRAVGAGMNVVIIQFMKVRTLVAKWPSDPLKRVRRRRNLHIRTLKLNGQSPAI